MFKSRLAKRQESRVVKCLLQTVILRDLAISANRLGHRGLVKDLGKVEAFRLVVVHRLLHFQPFGVTHHFVDRAKVELGHQLAHFPSDEAHEVDSVLRVAGKFFAQLRILRGHADRARIQMANAHHHAAQRHQRPGCKAELLRSEQCAYDHITAGLELAIHLDDDAAAQVVEDEHLVRLGQTKLPGGAGVLDARQGGGACPAVMAADQHHIGMRLGYACRNRADADFRHQLDADAGVMIGILQIVDQLRQVFDGVNIMVRRRRNQANARRRIADFGDPRIDFMARELTALARLGALGHLDLQLPGHDQVFTGNAKTGRGHLLDRAILRIAVGLRHVARRRSHQDSGAGRVHQLLDPGPPEGARHLPGSGPREGRGEVARARGRCVARGDEEGGVGEVVVDRAPGDRERHVADLSSGAPHVRTSRLRSAEFKSRSYRGQVTRWLELGFPDGRTRKIPANVIDFSTLRDVVLEEYARHH